MSLHNRYSDKSKYIYFMIKGEKIFLTNKRKCEQYNKKINGELICNKKYLKAEKDSTQKKPFNVFIYK